MPILHAQEPVEPKSIPWYEIEIILFSHDNQSTQFKEVLEEHVYLPELIDAIELTAPFIESEEKLELGYQRLPAEQLQLTTQFHYLEKSSKYTPRLHIGWRQPGQERSIAPAILIYPYNTTEQITVENYLNIAIELDTPVLGKSLQQPRIALEDNTNNSTDTIPPPVMSTNNWQEKEHIFGFIRLYLSRYLHIESDLILSVPVQVEPHHMLLDNIMALMNPYEQNNYYDTLKPFVFDSDMLMVDPIVTVTEQRFFHIDESRRLRKNELHYFDHPRFGLLITVRDYDFPVEEERDESEDSKTTTPLTQ